MYFTIIIFVFFNVTQITFFFVMQYAMSTLGFIFLMLKETQWLFQICQNCNQYSPPAAKICKYEGCKTMFPSKQFNSSEIDNMGMTNPTHQRELLEKRVTINTTLKKLKYHEGCSSRLFSWLVNWISASEIYKGPPKHSKTLISMCSRLRNYILEKVWVNHWTKFKCSMPFLVCFLSSLM